MSKRINRLLKDINNNNLDAIIISDKANIFYYSGFTSEDAILLIHNKNQHIITDFRYIEQAEQQCPEFNIVDMTKTKMFDCINNLCSEYNLSKIGVEEDNITYKKYQTMSREINNVELLNSKKIATNQRLIKDESEINSITKASKIGDKSFEHILDFIKPGITEKELALELEFFMRKSGSEGIAFDIIAASGENTSKPHAVQTARKLRQGDAITMDFGCIVNGYCSDMTRTVFLGEPSNELRKIYNIVLDAQLCALDKIKAGITGIEADYIAREIIDKHGYGKNFGHGLGHGVGLNVHELPYVSPRGDMVLKENMVISVEPGIYVSGCGGVRIEDLVVVKENGIVNLNSSSKRLIVL